MRTIPERTVHDADLVARLESGFGPAAPSEVIRAHSLEAPGIDKNGVDTWGFEGMSPNYLGRRGWTKSTLKPGDKISIVYRPLRDGSHGGMFVSAQRPSGEVLRMTGEPVD